ncbi:Sodium/bile acid cotransporter 7 isoform X1 [Oopsacas minuta]|uniref:Sodium/bile acid cotransporter 7 isoform X1 n=1 Tax=Oopsacas minuta TaxID=111878 RepID=A0AAV7K807_9METZ|nr:Sodium/bile acid cotransporter 7 isoform X1 [Oopsacas minuta]
MIIITQIQSFLSKHWFFIGVIQVILLAYIYPTLGVSGSPLHPEISVKIVGVSLIFLNSGLSIKTRDFAGALTNYKLHIFIQSYTLILIPLLMYLISPLLLLLSLDTWIVSGLQVVSCLPPPVSSAVILTKAIGGNEPASILNSALGSFLGVFFSPALIYLSLGLTTSVPFLSIIQSLTLTVLCPLVLGQLLRHFWIEDMLDPYKSYLTNFASCILLAIIYTAFSGTFHKGYADGISIYSLLIILFIILIVQLFLLSLSFIISTKLLSGFKRYDVICVLFCSTHKSLTLGIPMLGVIFGNTMEGVMYSIPLLVYHPMQIIIGGLLVPTLREWVASTETSRPKPNDEPSEDTVNTSIV